MTKAIIFDCFGVLTTEAWLPFKTKHFGHDPRLLAKVTDISWQADRGLMTREEAIRTTSELAGITPAEFAQAINRNVPDEALFAYIEELKPHYKIGLLSNVSGDYLTEIFDRQQLASFDAVTLSFQSGFIKPEKEAFETAAEQLGVNPEECIFIDDQERNVNGAERAGMTAILYRDVSQLRHELSKLLKP
jgi:putative hydrolase of the HAD superfamily